MDEWRRPTIINSRRDDKEREVRLTAAPFLALYKLSNHVSQERRERDRERERGKEKMKEEEAGSTHNALLNMCMYSTAGIMEELINQATRAQRTTGRGREGCCCTWWEVGKLRPGGNYGPTPFIVHRVSVCIYNMFDLAKPFSINQGMAREARVSRPAPLPYVHECMTFPSIMFIMGLNSFLR